MTSCRVARTGCTVLLVRVGVAKEAGRPDVIRRDGAVVDEEDFEAVGKGEHFDP